MIKPHQFQQYADQAKNITNCGKIAKQIFDAEDISNIGTIYGIYGISFRRTFTKKVTPTQNI